MTLLYSLDSLAGQRVSIYWNVRRKLYSVVHKGRVVAHVGCVLLGNAKPHVNRRGIEAIRRTGRKKVVARISGLVMGQSEPNRRLPWGVVFNPNQHDEFMVHHADNQSPYMWQLIPWRGAPDWVWATVTTYCSSADDGRVLDRRPRMYAY